MTAARERKRPAAAVLYREALPPRLAEIEEFAEVRLTKADGLAKALDGADVLYQWHSFSPALRENWDAASTLQWVRASKTWFTTASDKALDGPPTTRCR